MELIRSEEEVDKMIQEMIEKSKGRYITQGVAFNKNNKRHLEMLKYVLLRSESFSSYIKEYLAKKVVESENEGKPLNVNVEVSSPVVETKIKNEIVEEKKEESKDEKKDEKIDPGNFFA